MLKLKFGVFFEQLLKVTWFLKQVLLMTIGEELGDRALLDAVLILISKRIHHLLKHLLEVSNCLLALGVS